ncbi:MAG: hypothetical protein ACTSUE_19800 [Promethearchaeota archaeon]
MIKTDFTIVPDDRAFRRYLGKRADRILKSRRNAAIFADSKRELVALAKPAVAWRVFGVEGFAGDSAILSVKGRVRFGGGPFRDVVEGATEIVIAVCTIGPAVEMKVGEYLESGETFHGFLLDSMASWAVGNVRDQFLDWIHKEYHSKKCFHTSIHLSPGESTVEPAWSINDQLTLFELLDGETGKIGVILEESLLMRPVKSLSLAFGAGPGSLGDESRDPCHLCTLKETCNFNTQEGKN